MTKTENKALESELEAQEQTIVDRVSTETNSKEQPTERKIRVPQDELDLEKQIEDLRKQSERFDKDGRKAFIEKEIEPLVTKLKRKRFKRVVELRLKRLEKEYILINRVITSPNYAYSLDQGNYVKDVTESWQDIYVTSVIMATNEAEESEVNVPD